MSHGGAVAPEVRGLTAGEATERLARYGPNALPEAEPVRWWARVGRQLRSSIIYILLFALAFDVVIWISEGAHEWPFESIAIATILLFNTVMGVWQEYRAEDDPCDTPQFSPDALLPDPLRSEGLKGLKTRGDVAGPNGIRLVYRGQTAELQGAFARIAEQMALCAADVPFQEQGRDGMFQVQILDNAAVGDEQVAARVSDVGPNMSGVGWTAQYYWIGFARDGDTLAAVQLRERWEGTGAEDWPEQYPQPTLADEELTTQLAAALASTE